MLAAGSGSLTMQTACMIVAHPFWAEPLGCGAVVRGRHRLLSQLFNEVRVLFLSGTSATCPLPGATFHLHGALSREDVLQLKRYLDQEQFSALYFSYDLGGLAHQLDGYKMLELHDVMHLRQLAFSEYGYAAPISVKPADELASMQRYDCVLVLNNEERRYLADQGVDQAVYLPPSVTFVQSPVSPEARPIGLIGSQAKPNLHGLQECLGLLGEVGGAIAGPLSQTKEVGDLASNSLLNMGIIDDVADFYRQVDVVLSPIKFGAGLKIKVLEAIAHGRPLLATEHSIAGFPDGIRDFVLVEDDISIWNAELVAEAKKRRKSDFEGFCRANFSDEVLADKLRAVFAGS